MTLLLDTHILILFLDNDPQLPANIRTRIETTPNVYISIASLWEIAIKINIGKYSAWIAAVAEVLVTAGLDRTTAQQRGEDLVIALQGSLIVAQGMNQPEIFQRSLQQLPQQLCRDLAT